MKSQYFDRVVILEDDQFFGNLMKFYLINQDVRNVHLFQDEDECLRKTPIKDRILYILDHHLIHSNGLEIMSMLKERNQESRFIYVSGQDFCHIAIQAIKEGALDYIEKNKETLVKLGKTVKALCENPEIDTQSLYQRNFRTLKFKDDPTLGSQLAS